MPRLTSPLLPADVLASTDQPTLRRAGLTLRPWSTQDASAVVSAYADPQIQRWTRERVDPEEADEWISRWHESWESGTGAAWSVLLDSDVVGWVGLPRISAGVGQAEIGYWTIPAVRGRGVAVAAVRTLSEWTFGRGFRRIELLHATTNTASCTVAMRAGYPAEGVRRSAGLHADGLLDMHLHARLATDPPVAR